MTGGVWATGALAWGAAAGWTAGAGWGGVGCGAAGATVWVAGAAGVPQLGGVVRRVAVDLALDRGPHGVALEVGAEEVGMKAVCYKNFAQFERDIINLLQ